MSILFEALIRAIKSYKGVSPLTFFLLAAVFIYRGEYKRMFTVFFILSLLISVDVLVAFRREYKRMMMPKVEDAKAAQNDGVLEKKVINE